MTKNKNTPLTDDELAVFKEAVRGVKRLKLRPKADLAQPKRPPVVRKQRVVVDEETLTFSDFEKLPLVSTEDVLFFAKSGLQHKVLRKLRQGQYTVEATLDLHGYTVSEARELLSEFLLHCIKDGIRHVLIIHGKGRANSKPILKNKLNHWLRQLEQVVAFCSAGLKEGRTGALYVLLRRETVG